MSKDSSESPEFENAATPFHETELRITDDFDRSQEDELLSPTLFSTVGNSMGVSSIIDVVSGFENGCDHRDQADLEGFNPLTSSVEYNRAIESDLGAVAQIMSCGYSVKNGSGSRSDDSALPSSADNSDGSNAMGMDTIINRNSNPTLENLSDSGEILPVNALLDSVPKSKRNLGFNLNLETAASSIPNISSPIKDNVIVTESVSLHLPLDDEEGITPPDLPPRTYKAPPLPPRNRSNEAPPLPPRAEKPHLSMQTSSHSVTTPTSPARSVESLDFVNLAPLEPPPLPPRTYSPINMSGLERGVESESGGSISLLSTEDSDSRSFDSMEAFSGSRESLQNDSGGRLGQDVMKREHKKLHRLSQGKCAKNSLSNSLLPTGAGFGAECVENQRPVSPATREWRRSAEVVPLDRGESNQSPPPIVHRHRQTKDSDRLQSLDTNLTDRHRSTSFDSPVDRLRSMNLTVSTDSVDRTQPTLDRLRMHGGQDQTPPPVERPHPSDTHNTHRPVNLSHSVPRGRLKEPPPLVNDRSKSFEFPPTFDRQRSVDSIPVDRLRNYDPQNTHPSIEMSPSLPPFIDRHSGDSMGDFHTSGGQLKNCEGQNIYSPVLELQPPIYSRQRSYEPPSRPVERQHSNESSKSGSSGFSGGLPSTKPPVRRSLSPAVRRLTDSPSDLQGAVGGWSFSDSPLRPETPPRPGPLSSGRTSTPSPPVIFPRSRITEEERQRNILNINQHLQKWTQKHRERANSSFGSSEAGDLDLSSPTSETRSIANGHCSWETFEDMQPHSHGTLTGDSSMPGSMETVLGAEGGSTLPGHGAIASMGGRLSPPPASSVIWQLRHEDDHPPPSIDSGLYIYHKSSSL